jgi:Fur family ferric uptake transcriptional regulator
MNEATVYRTLEFLAGNGILLVADRGNGHLAYELSGESHHHLICRTCGAQMELDPGLFAPTIRQVESETGYRLNASHLTFFGLCPDCKSSSQ